jgi:lipid II:glycine glycyltransferase (peptidoglycan interpeptide bridge formation enzyme)
MEASKNSQIKTVLDIRQSEKWAGYLGWLKWKSVKTNSNVNVEVMKMGLGSVVKVQRPHLLYDKDFEEIEKVSKENKAIFIKIESMQGQDVDIFKKYGYLPSIFPLAPPSTIYIDLTKSESELWNNISKSGRYSIRRSGKFGEKVEFFCNPSSDILQKFYDISKASSYKQGFTIQSFEDLKKKTEIFGNEAWVVLGFDKEGKATGGKFFLGYNKVVWYVHAGTNELGRKLDAGHKMMWESFLYFKKMGYEVLDMDGIDDQRFPNFTKNWGGFSFFKEKFGGDVVRFPEPQIKYLHPILIFMSKFRPLPL